MRPAPLLLGLLPAWAALGALALAGRVPMAAWWWTAAVLALLALADAVRLRRQPTPEVERRLADGE